MALFRRTKSPRSVEFRTTAVTGLGNADKPGHHSEEHKRKEKKSSKSFSAHRRHKSDELNSIVELTEVVEPPSFLSQSEEVVEYQLSDPSPLYPPPQLPPRSRHRGGSGGAFNYSRSRPGGAGWRRTQSGGTTMSSPQHHQQVPHQEYFVPVDTLKAVHRSSFLPPQNGGTIAEHIHSGAGGVSGTGHHSSHSSSKDKRNIEMHNKIVAQNDPLLMSNKRKSRSLENLVDCSDYSLPFDVVSERNDGSQGSKSRSPEGGLQVINPSQNQKTHSDSNLSMHNTSTPPAKPARRTRDLNPPSFAPPPPPSSSGETPPDLSPNSTNHRPKMDDYEEPWNSSKFLPNRSRRNRAETDITRVPHPHHMPSLGSDHKSPKPHRSHTIHHDTSPDSEQVPGVPPRIVSSQQPQQQLPSSPQLDPHRPRTTTGELVGDYCIPPDAILHDFNGLGINGNTSVPGWGGGGAGGRAGGEEHVRAYVNQPPVPPPPTHRTVNSDINQKHRYPPLVPSEYYITDIQSLPPPAFAIDTSLPLEEQP